jgi:hypothetical protein
MKGIVLVVAVFVLPGIEVSAHHAHPDFALDQQATVSGTIEQMIWQGGHAVLTLRTADSTLYTAEWQSANYLDQGLGCVYPNSRVTKDTLKVGDFIVVVGAPAKDPARHELVNLKQVSRPVDQWRWTC